MIERGSICQNVLANQLSQYAYVFCFFFQKSRAFLLPPVRPILYGETDRNHTINLLGPKLGRIDKKTLVMLSRFWLLGGGRGRVGEGLELVRYKRKIVTRIFFSDNVE